MNQADKKRWILAGMILLLLAGCTRNLAGVEPSATPIADETTAPLPSLEVGPGVTILADGVVQTARPALPLAFETGGQLQAVHVQAGDTVQAGDRIATLDDTVLQEAVTSAGLGVAQAEASLISAEAQLARLLASPSPQEATRARLIFEEVERELVRAQDTYDLVSWIPEIGLQAQVALEQATRNYQRAQVEYRLAVKGPSEEEIVIAESSVTQAQVALEQAQLQLEQAENALAGAQLTAPRSGTVLSVDVALGAKVGTGTSIVTLLDLDQLEFHTTNLSERDLAQIFPGQTALVTLKSYPNEPIEATVIRIGAQAGPAIGDAATFPVMLTLSETPLDIRPGMTGRAEIHPADE